MMKGSRNRHLPGARIHAGAVQHILQPHAGPARIAHGAVRPFAAGHARLKEAARIARALVHRRQLDMRKAVQNVVERQRQHVVHMAADAELERVDVDLRRDDGPVPAHIEFVVRREHALVENGPWRFQERRARPLQDHDPFCANAVVRGGASGPPGKGRSIVLARAGADRRARPPRPAVPSGRRRDMK